MAAKNGGKLIFVESCQLTLLIPGGGGGGGGGGWGGWWGGGGGVVVVGGGGVKTFDEIALSHSFRDKCVFAVYAEIQDASKMVG